MPDRCNTKARLLDAAEILFARNGYQRTSIKALAQRASVNLAAVNYHFGSKKALMEKVIERRLASIRQRRMEMFQALEDAMQTTAGPPDVQAVLRAFVEPVFSVAQGGSLERCFLLIEGRGLAETDEAVRCIYLRHLRPAYARLVSLMAAALPDLPAAVLQWRIHFAMGALAHALRVCGDHPSGPDFFPPVHADRLVIHQLVTFLTHGMRAQHAPPEDAPKA